MDDKQYMQITEIIQKLLKKGEQEKLLQLFADYHATNLEQVDEKDYPHLLDDLRKLNSIADCNDDVSAAEFAAETGDTAEKIEEEALEVDMPIDLNGLDDDALHDAPLEHFVSDDSDSKSTDELSPPVQPLQEAEKTTGNTSVQSNRKYSVVVFGNCKEAKGEQEEVSEGAIYNRMQNPVRLDITRQEWDKLPPDKQADYKDGGLYLLARSKDGRRAYKSLLVRSALTFDLDAAPNNIGGLLEKLPFRTIYHTTFKSKSDALRVRIIILLLRDITPEEYARLTPMIAKEVGEEYVDPASYKPTQAMYFPVVPKDGEFWCKRTEGPLLNPDDYLGKAEGEDTSNPSNPGNGDDPGKKAGIIGAYNTVHPIQALLDNELSDVYEPTNDPKRYHYRGADSTAGVIVGSDGYIRSFHASDPAYGRRLCSFDLYRIHKFGYLDKGIPQGTPLNKLPSQKAMIAFAKKDAAVQKEYQKRQQSQNTWKAKLKRDRRGNIARTLENLQLILTCDSQLETIRYNLFSKQYEAGKLPWKRQTEQWNDKDWANLFCYLEMNYGFYSGCKIAFSASIPTHRSYHPIRDYINEQAWDGKERLDTLLVDYLGAEDSPYTRAVTRKAMVAMVARVFFDAPVKFDYMPIICGPQGIGKSTLLSKLALRPEWFTDSVSVADMRDVKKAGEKIQNKLLVEISELQGMPTTELESIKAFLSSSRDTFRKAYATDAEDYPRQCIIWGTTNSTNGYLRDTTGNRRFWPINVSGHGTKHSWDLDEATVGQILAEAKYRIDQGEELYLSGDLAKEAETMQRDAMEKDDREGLVLQYLNTLLPENWEEMTVAERQNYIANPVDGSVVRDRVSVIEISCECFCRDPKAKLSRKEGDAIRAIMQAHSDEWVLHTDRNGKPSAQMRKPYGKQRVYYRVLKKDKVDDEGMGQNET